MECILYKTTSNEKTLHKELTQVATIGVEWKSDTDILHPTVILGGSLPKANYLYIPTFGRYYFIKNMKVDSGRNVIEIECEVDVLMSYADKLSQLSCVMKRQANIYNTYLADDNFLTNNKTSLFVHEFESHLPSPQVYLLTM